MANYKTEVLIIGGGLAGIVAALELVEKKISVLMLDRDSEENLGGLAPWAFGGMALVGTPLQKKGGVHDTPEIALSDWHRFAEFSDDDFWPRKWAEIYVNRSLPDVYHWLTDRDIRFFPFVNWVERGEYGSGNSLPRYHFVWGTGYELTRKLVMRLKQPGNQNYLTIKHDHNVTALRQSGNRICGCEGVMQNNDEAFEVEAGKTIVATGGLNGDIERVRKEWMRSWGNPPANMLNGSHPYADGRMHDEVKRVGGHLTHLDKMWNYAAGVHHPQPRFPDHGISLVPPKSALWLDSRGKRIGPRPLVTGFDTHEICKAICQTEDQYSWQVLNRKIALKEVAVSGSEHNPSFRDKKLFRFLYETLRGNQQLYDYLTTQCEDFIVAGSLPELVDKMNVRSVDGKVSLENVRAAVNVYDAQIDRGPKLHNDDQLRKIEQARRWKSDRVRTCKFQKILDKDALPLVAIRELILSRKTLGGIQTDDHSRVLGNENIPIEGLYAVGEAAGFGGGGASGLKSLEGTFLSGCILTAQIAAKDINS
jgi:predicted oxidoreductase